MRRLLSIALATAGCTASLNSATDAGSTPVDVTEADAVATIDVASPPDAQTVLDAIAPFDGPPSCATTLSFSSCDGEGGAPGACRKDPPMFDGGVDAAYPVGCVAYYTCPTQGCTCMGQPDSGFYWSCTLK